MTAEAHSSYKKMRVCVAFPSHQIIHQMFNYLSLYFIVEELLPEFGQGVVCTVVVQVQGVQHIPEGG